jgi:hypothetical protein
MKEDVGPPPERPPHKRRQLEQVHDQWLAVWLAGETLTPSERRRVQAEKDRRKKSLPRVIVGITATREGMTPPQRRWIQTFLEEHCTEELIEAGMVEGHHGDCIGGDVQFDEICHEMGIPVVIHPPIDARLRAWCKGAVRVEKAKPYLERNKDIVRACTVLLGAPKESREPSPARGQGTWSTIRYARQRAKQHFTIMPDGTIQDDSKERVA